MGISDAEIEIKRSTGMSFLWNEIQQIKKQIERGFCPNCGKGMVKPDEKMAYRDNNYVVCPQCSHVVNRK